MEQVVGETVVVIQQQQHGFTRPSKPVFPPQLKRPLSKPGALDAVKGKAQLEPGVGSTAPPGPASS
jgi:hypothetical protein